MKNKLHITFTKGFLFCSALCFFSVRFTFAQQNEKEFIDSIVKYKYRDAERTLELIAKAKKLFLNDSSQIKFLRSTGDVYWKRSQFDSSIYFYKKALLLAEKSKHKKLQASLNNDLGYLYMEKDSYEKALEYYITAQKISNANNFDKTKKIALTYMGLIYSRLNDTTNALKYQRQVLNDLIKLDDEVSQAVLLNNIGNTYYKAKDYENAIVHYKKSAALDKKHNVEFNYYQTLSNIGTSYTALKKYGNAINYFDQAIPGLLKSNNYTTLSGCYESLTQIYFEQKNYALAAKYEKEFFKAIAITKDRGTLINFMGVMAPLYAEQGDYKKAYDFNLNYFLFNDSLNRATNVNALAEQKATFDLDKKQNEIDLLNKNKELQEAADKRKQVIIYFFIGFSLLLLITVYIAVRSFLTKKKANKLLQESHNEISMQKTIIEEHQKEILDSIHYAKRIQNTLLAHKDFVNEHIKENFILFKPKDIVSGDFYWAAKHGSNFYLAACDSTGHGVPGAFMSLLNINFLNEAINEKDILEPNKVLNFVRERLIKSISKDGQKDGFDGILLRINEETKEITYAAANNAPVLISGDLLNELQADRMPVGQGMREEDFKLYTINAKPGDTLYLYTDGFADQFGGPKGKKFKYKALNELILSIAQLPLEKQAAILDERFEEWRGSLEQVDDVCIIGFRL